VRFYLYRVGLWLYMWKRSLTFYWQREHPRPLFEFEGGVARLAVMQGDARVVLATAQMRGDRLEFHGPSPEQLEDPAQARPRRWPTRSPGGKPSTASTDGA
jgi:hypothetical protein